MVKLELSCDVQSKLHPKMVKLELSCDFKSPNFIQKMVKFGLYITTKFRLDNFLDEVWTLNNCILDCALTSEKLVRGGV
jgi:hypothetical protein